MTSESASETLVAEVLKCGEAPEVAIEATYGWYWAVDALQAAGANVHLVAPSRLTAFEGRRVKNDQKDCQVLGDLMRANMLPQAWISTHPRPTITVEPDPPRPSIGLAYGKTPLDKPRSFIDDKFRGHVHVYAPPG